MTNEQIAAEEEFWEPPVETVKRSKEQIAAEFAALQAEAIERVLRYLGDRYGVKHA